MMSSLNFSTANMPTANLSGGVHFGSMGEGGGSNFYMGDEEQGEQEKREEKNKKNPDLLVIDQAKENEKNQNRQYLEELITGNNNRSWINPWTMSPNEREEKTRNAEIEEMKRTSSERINKKMLIINA